MSIVELMNMFPTEDAATKWFEDVLWAGERCCGKCGSVNTREVPTCEADALLVLGLPELFQRADRHGHRALERPDAEVGHRHLPLPHQPEERVKHEAPPRPGRVSENGLVHAASHPRGMGGPAPRCVRWPCGGR